MAPTLVQFPVSHYCEKARWALDRAGVAYDVKNVAFGEHVFALPKVSGAQPTVPALLLDGRVIGDSDAILRWADAQAKTSLFPTMEPARTEVESFVRVFDDELGRAVRVVAYAHILPDLAVFRRAAFGELSSGRRRVSELAAPVLRALIRRRYGIEKRLARSEETLRTIAERCDRALGTGDFLVGGKLTAADVVGASLWAPLLDVPGTPWAGLEVPGLLALRDELMARPVGRWVHATYARHRRWAGAGSAGARVADGSARSGWLTLVFMKPGDHPEFFHFPAPPGQSRESTIRLDREGRFLHDGELVEHPRLAAAMHTWIARHPDDGRYILTNGYDWTYFTVEDAPFTVRACDVDERGAVTLVLSNEDRVALDPKTLSEGPDGALYAEVELKGGRFDARFTRFAQAGLAPALIEEGGRVGVRSDAGAIVPRKRAAASPVRA